MLLQVAALVRAQAAKTGLYNLALELHGAGQLERACEKYQEAVSVRVVRVVQACGCLSYVSNDGKTAIF